MRFEQTVGRLRRDPKAKLADLSAEVGYADQAHLSREVRALAGVPLTNLLAAAGQP
jgi:AraC-like DNA-binding protein